VEPKKSKTFWSAKPFGPFGLVWSFFWSGTKKKQKALQKKHESPTGVLRG